MRGLRAILVSILVWVLIFVEISIVKIGFGFIGVSQSILHYVFLVFWGSLAAAIYYSTGDRLNGFVLGIFIVLVVTILDLIITVPFFIGSYTEFYFDGFIWVGFLVLIVVTGVYEIVIKT